MNYNVYYSNPRTKITTKSMNVYENTICSCFTVSMQWESVLSMWSMLIKVAVTLYLYNFLLVDEFKILQGINGPC